MSRATDQSEASRPRRHSKRLEHSCFALSLASVGYLSDPNRFRGLGCFVGNITQQNEQKKQKKKRLSRVVCRYRFLFFFVEISFNLSRHSLTTLTEPFLPLSSATIDLSFQRPAYSIYRLRASPFCLFFLLRTGPHAFVFAFLFFPLSFHRATSSGIQPAFLTRAFLSFSRSFPRSFFLSPHLLLDTKKPHALFFFSPETSVCLFVQSLVSTLSPFFFLAIQTSPGPQILTDRNLSFLVPQ